tara:strand:+ start:2252 stop:2932 length:681 start_codon:yes stop_codon:yes gene_type:complete
MPYIDLNEVGSMVQMSPFWSVNGRNLISIFEDDYMGGYGEGWAASIQEFVEASVGDRPDGHVAILAHPRHFGYVFNPVSFYFCFDSSNTLHSMVADVTNTPWGERRAYAIRAVAGNRVTTETIESGKQLHVSPFIGMDMAYTFSFADPGDTDTIDISICVSREEERILDTRLVMKTYVPNKFLMNTLPVRFPFMTHRVTAGIYWNALLLKLKGAQFFAHPGTKRSK